MGWREGYTGIPGKDYAAHNAARILLMDVLTGLSLTPGFKREFHRSRYDSADPAGVLRTLALVNAHLPDEWGCGMLNELSPAMLSGAALSIARHYGVEPTKAPADPAASDLHSAMVAKGGAHTPLAWGNIGAGSGHIARGQLATSSAPATINREAR